MFATDQRLKSGEKIFYCQVRKTVFLDERKYVTYQFVIKRIAFIFCEKNDAFLFGSGELAVETLQMSRQIQLFVRH